MTVGETLTNLMWARVSSLEDVKASGNWMWAVRVCIVNVYVATIYMVITGEIAW